MPPMSPEHPTQVEGNGHGMKAIRPLTPNPFRLPNNPGPNAVYARAIIPANPGAVPDPAPLMMTEQATTDTIVTCCKNYYLYMVNIEGACFTAVDDCINNMFKVSNNPTIQGWHTGM
jgi:hypothetical protein